MEGGLSLLNIEVQIQDKLGAGIRSVYFALDLKVAVPDYNATTGVASYSVAGLMPGKHTLNVLARDNLGNQYERGWAFNTDPAPPPITDVSFDGETDSGDELYTAMYITFEGDLNPGTVGNAAFWQILNPQGSPVSTVTSVDLIRNIGRARIHLSPAIPLVAKYQIVISYGEGPMIGYYGYRLDELPQQGSGFSPGAGGDSIGGGGGDSWPPWQDYLFPLTPINACLCSPHDPVCDTPEAPTGVHFGGYLVPIDGPPVPPPPDPPGCGSLYYWENFDPNQTYDSNWWCSHFRICLKHQPGYQENYILNKDIRWLADKGRYDYDLDMTHDCSWEVNAQCGPPHWDNHPPQLKYGDADPTHATLPCPHGVPPVNPWNLFNIREGRPPPEIYPHTPDWGRGEPFQWVSRYLSAGEECGTFNQQTIHITEAQADNQPPDFVPPYPMIITADQRLHFRENYAAGGIIIGQDSYVAEYNSDPPSHIGDRFIAVVARDPEPHRTLLMGSPAPDFENHRWDLPAGLGYACGDRAYLSQPDPTAPSPGRVIDRLMVTGDPTNEDKLHACDWGVVTATYMIDEPPNAVNSGNPPTQKDCILWPTRTNDDPDCSARYERAVWFVPLGNMRLWTTKFTEEKMKYWVRADDNQGSWRIASGIDPNVGCTGSCLTVTITEGPAGEAPPRSKICCNELSHDPNQPWQRIYADYYLIRAHVNDTLDVPDNPRNGIMAIWLEVCTTWDSEHSKCTNDNWVMEVVEGDPQICYYDSPYPPTVDCQFKLNTWTRQATSFAYRVVAQAPSCRWALATRAVTVLASLECPHIGEVGPNHCTDTTGEDAGCYGAARGALGNHTGTDLQGADGSTPVYSPCYGEVTFTRGNVTGEHPCGGGDCGNRVDIQCNNGVHVRFCHLSDVSVAVGDRLTSDTVVGHVGRTGDACHCDAHLHYVIFDPNHPDDPHATLDPQRFNSACVTTEGNYSDANRQNCCQYGATSQVFCPVQLGRRCLLP